MKKIFTTLLFAAASATMMAQEYYVVSPTEDSLAIVDGSAVFQSKTAVTETGGATINGFTALAKNPISGVVYTVIKGAQGDPLKLATLDIPNSTATAIGDLSDKIAGLAFDDAGTLYGISGDGGSSPANLYTVDVTNAALVQLADLDADADDDGESIGFNPDDGFMYRLGGGTYLYKINMTTFTQTLVTDQLSNGGISGHALYYNGTDFISLTNDMCNMDMQGAQSNCNSLGSYDAKGIILKENVGVEELDALEAMKVYPNPTNGLFNVSTEKSIETITVTDVSGKTILSRSFEGAKEAELSLDDAATGLHFVTVHFADGSFAKSKVQVK